MLKEIHGQMVDVKICKPSRRRAGSSIQKPKYQKINSQRGEKHVANENGQFNYDKETP